MKENVKKDLFLKKWHGSWSPGLTVLIYGFLLCGFDNVFAKSSSEFDPNICSTYDCNGYAYGLVSNMKKYMNPCVNFYQYACGKYAENWAIYDEVDETFHYHGLQERIDDSLIYKLMNSVNTGDNKLFRLLQQFYKSCMNREKRELDKQNVENKIMEDIRLSGGWPILDGDSWNETNFDWLNMTLKLQELGYLEDSFFSTALSKEGGHMAIIPTRNPIFSEPYNGDYDSYKTHIASTAELFGASDDICVDEEMLQVENFMKELDKAKQDNPDKQWMTIPGLEQNFPNIRWTQYVKAQVPVPDTFSKIQQILLIDPEYIRKLQSSIAQTPKRTIANYIVSKVISNLKNVLHIIVSGGRLEKCMKETKEQLPIALSSFYIQENFNQGDKTLNDVTEMVSYVNKTFVNMIQKNTWMTDQYKYLLVTKLNTMKVNVGYPAELLNNSTMEEYYKNIELSDSFFENRLRLQKFRRYEKMANLEQPTNNYEWTEFAKVAVDVSGTNLIRETNTLQIPAALLQDTFVRRTLPKYVRYGELGFEIARQFARSFSPDGICYNERGEKNDTRANVLNSMPRYKRIVGSITKLYSNFTVKGLKINGTNTLDENFADIFGLRGAYRAYREDVKDERQQKLPRIFKSPHQLFWLSFAGGHCSKMQDSYLRKLIANGEHSPTRARILMTLKLIPGFARDYRCARGSQMNNITREYGYPIKHAFS